MSLWTTLNKAKERLVVGAWIEKYVIGHYMCPGEFHHFIFKMIQFNHISKAMSDFIFDHFHFFCFFKFITPHLSVSVISVTIVGFYFVNGRAPMIVSMCPDPTLLRKKIAWFKKVITIFFLHIIFFFF